MLKAIENTGATVKPRFSFNKTLDNNTGYEIIVDLDASKVMNHTWNMQL